MLNNCEGSCAKGTNQDCDEKCIFWAKAGECKKNPDYMLKNCKESCQNQGK